MFTTWGRAEGSQIVTTAGLSGFLVKSKIFVVKCCFLIQIFHLERLLNKRDSMEIIPTRPLMGSEMVQCRLETPDNLGVILINFCLQLVSSCLLPDSIYLFLWPCPPSPVCTTTHLKALRIFHPRSLLGWHMYAQQDNMRIVSGCARLPSTAIYRGLSAAAAGDYFRVLPSSARMTEHLLLQSWSHFTFGNRKHASYHRAACPSRWRLEVHLLHFLKVETFEHFFFFFFQPPLRNSYVIFNSVMY